MRFTPPTTAMSQSPRPQAARGQMHGHQGRRTGRVDRRARPLPVEEVAQATRGGSVSVTGSQIRIDLS